VIFLFGSSPTITGCTIINASAKHGFYLQNSSPEISASTISDMSEAGLFVTGFSSPLVFNNTISDNDIGIRLSGHAAGFFRGNTISGNTSFGVNNLTGNVIDAEYNYWGDPNGPYDPFGGPSSGSGDEVSANVDYDPWVGDNYDTDNDGMPDDWEIGQFTDTTTADDTTDFENDGLLDIHEFAYGSDPKSYDSEGDGMPDAWEAQYKFNPVADDSREDADLDNFSNLREYISGTDPTDDQDIPPILKNGFGDYDMDGEDLAGMTKEYGRTNCQTVACDFDFDSNGVVNDTDLFLFSEDYGRID
jgi:parallel beta-helix repeat protein